MTTQKQILKHHVKKWGWVARGRYYVWVKETYGDVDNPNKYTDNYRALKQLEWSMRSPIDKQPTRLITSAGMVKMAQQILNESMKEVYEKHGHNLTGL